MAAATFLCSHGGMRPSLALPFAVLVAGCGASTAPPPRAPDAPVAAPTTPDGTSPASSAPTAPTTEEPAAPSRPAVELVEVDAPPSPQKLPSITFSSPSKGQLIGAAKAGAFPIKVSVRAGDTETRWCASLDAGPCTRLDPTRGLTLAELAPTLAEGQHVLAILALHPTGHAVRPIKKTAAFSVVSFFVEKRTKPVWKDGDPLVIALPPADGPTKNGELVIDYYVANAEVAEGKHLVQIALAGPGLSRAETSSTGRPFHVKNARAGGYLVRIALARYAPELGESGSTTTVKYTSKTMTGALVDVTRKFSVTD